ncbi:MAG: hypothetical protein HW416_2478, partial [Chloroflexi bacterium]|nr:hypothetical protein [Chloroflexota bacterium]
SGVASSPNTQMAIFASAAPTAKSRTSSRPTARRRCRRAEFSPGLRPHPFRRLPAPPSVHWSDRSAPSFHPISQAQADLGLRGGSSRAPPHPRLTALRAAGAGRQPFFLWLDCRWQQASRAAPGARRPSTATPPRTARSTGIPSCSASPRRPPPTVNRITR